MDRLDECLKRPYLLLTPGPLSTSEGVRTAMLKDWCTWDKAYNNLVEEIRKEINADSLDYLSMENMLKSLKNRNYCVGCFNGEYPMSTPVED